MVKFINLEAALNEMHRIHLEFEVSGKDDKNERDVYDSVMNTSYIILSAYAKFAALCSTQEEKDGIEKEGMKYCLKMANLYLEEYGD